MKFLCLAYYDEAKYNALPKDQLEAIVSKCPAYDAELRDTGKMLFSASLGEPKETICIRPKNGKPSFTDGPFAEAKEMIGGFFMIEVADAEEARRIASHHPAAHLGEHIGWGVEVRPVGFYLDGQR
ncbi:MAG: hypothetical protein GC190_00875 [Alphaproteobacteria bacterium]|nr:hypothetical protein [Alphaproteobacteria bacterium]